MWTVISSIEARWGDSADVYVAESERMRCQARVRDVWSALARLTATKVDPPFVTEVHSHKALPALVRRTDQEPVLVWDAGLGTLFDSLSFAMPFAQPAPVVEALLRRVIAVRMARAGRVREAASEAERATVLLRQTPIDRSYQERVDAEMNFEIVLLTEMQERFALAHELMHYIKLVDDAAFNAFEERIRGAAGRAASTPVAPSLPLRQLLLDQLSAHTRLDLYDLDLDPYAWYLPGRSGEQIEDQPNPTWGKQTEYAMNFLAICSAEVFEEIACDVAAGLSVALAAHLRQHGWTAIMAAACSRLALSNLSTILTIDGWVEGQTTAPQAQPDVLAGREGCLNVLLPQMLPPALEAHSDGTRLQAGDIHTVLDLVASRHKLTIEAVLSDLQVAAAGVGHTAGLQEAILRAGFLYLRPEVDHRIVNRTAGGHKFDIGNVVVFPGLQAKLAEGLIGVWDVEEALKRHQRGEWGDVEAEDAAANDAGLDREFEAPSVGLPMRRDDLWSAYTIRGNQVLVITTHDRTQTKVMLMSEYC